MQQQAEARWRIERFAIDADGVVLHLVVGVQHLALRIGDRALSKQLGHLLTAAITEIGDMFDQLHARAPRPRMAEISLKPSRSAATRTCPKLSLSTCS